jgi:hypothetical protein
MMIDRRTFVLGTGFAAVTPTLGLSLPQFPPPATSITQLAFMIEGWSTQDDGRHDNQVWMRVGHEWRTAWR